MSKQKDMITKGVNLLHRRKHDYLVTFPKDNEQAKIVLKDLAKFCRADKTTFHSDSRVHALMEGRREVYLRIRDHLDLSVDDLYKKYSKL